jgi:hypothetical protein
VLTDIVKSLVKAIEEQKLEQAKQTVAIEEEKRGHANQIGTLLDHIEGLSSQGQGVDRKHSGPTV